MYLLQDLSPQDASSAQVVVLYEPTVRDSTNLCHHPIQ